MKKKERKKCLHSTDENFKKKKNLIFFLIKFFVGFI